LAHGDGKGAQFRIALKIKGGSWLACESGGAVGMYVAWPTAIAASLRLERSHIFLAHEDGKGAQFRTALKIKGGSWLACDGGGAVGIYVA